MSDPRLQPRSVVRRAVLLTLALALALVAAPAHAVDTDYLFGFGAQGTGDGQFQLPTEISIGPSGFVYVLDHGNQRIQKFDADGNFLGKWNSARVFQGPMTSLAATSDGLVYVQATYYFVKYDGDGGFLGSHGPFGGASSGGHHITEDRAGHLYLEYWSNGFSQAQRFLSTPGILAPTAAGGFGSGTGVLGRLAIRPNGEIFASDRDVQTDAPYMARRTSAGVEIVRWSQPDFVTNATCDLLGNLYACEQGRDVVRVFDEGGGVLAAFGGSGSAPGQFLEPSDVAVGPDGRIYVVDRGNHRVQVFGNGSTPAAPTSWGRVKAEYR